VINARSTLMSAIVTFSLWLSCAASADSLQSAKILLKVSNSAQQFSEQTKNHITDVLRTYSSIVAMETGIELPITIRSAIADCYSRAYDWSKFEGGFADILSQHLSGIQIDLLIGFYRNKSIPPAQIENFKNAIGSAGAIAKNSADLIYKTSPGCVKQDAQIIIGYLSDAGLKASHHGRIE